MSGDMLRERCQVHANHEARVATYTNIICDGYKSDLYADFGLGMQHVAKLKDVVNINKALLLGKTKEEILALIARG